MDLKYDVKIWTGFMCLKMESGFGKTLMILMVPLNTGNSFTGWATVSFSQRTHFHGDHTRTGSYGPNRYNSETWPLRRTEFVSDLSWYTVTVSPDGNPADRGSPFPNNSSYSIHSDVRLPGRSIWILQSYVTLGILTQINETFAR